MSTVRARYLNGDEVALVNCDTINAIKVQIANLHNKIAADIQLLTSVECVELSEDAKVPQSARVVINERDEYESILRATILAHAKEQDERGLARLKARVGEKFWKEGCTQALEKCLKPMIRFEKPFGDQSEACACTLIRCGADVSQPYGRGRTALFCAAELGLADVCKALLTAGIDVNHEDEDEETALFDAAERGSADVCRVLVAAGANVNHECDGRSTSLICAVHNRFGDASCAKVCKVLITAGANVNHRDEFNTSVLIVAAEKGMKETCKALISGGADVNHEDEYKRTALIFAARNGHVEVCRALIAAGSNVNHVDESRKTALRLAATSGNGQLSELLLTAGAVC